MTRSSFPVGDCPESSQPAYSVRSSRFGLSQSKVTFVSSSFSLLKGP